MRISTITSLQLFPLFFALHKARTRREKLKAVSAIMTFQSHRMEVPVFRRISIHPSTERLLPYLLASLRESPKGDLDPLHQSINLTILYGTEKRFKKMFRLSSNFFECIRYYSGGIVKKCFDCLTMFSNVFYRYSHCFRVIVCPFSVSFLKAIVCKTSFFPDHPFVAVFWLASSSTLYVNVGLCVYPVPLYTLSYA